MTKLRLGIIGAGLIGKTHIRTALEIPDFEVVGVADPDPAALAIAEEYSLKGYKSHQELLATTKPDRKSVV